MMNQKTAEHESMMVSPGTITSAKRLIEENDLDGLRSLLASYSPEEKRTIFQDNELGSSLHVAFHHGNLELLTFLLEECRIDVNHRKAEGVTVLYLAVESAKVVMTRFLLDHGAVVNFTENDSGTEGCAYISVLRAAFVGGNPKIFRMLLTAGLELKMWSRPKAAGRIVFKRDTFDDMVRCAIDFGLCREENQEVFEHFLEAAARHGSETFDVLWPHRPSATDDFRLAKQALRFSYGREKTMNTILSQGSLSFPQRVDLMEYLGAWWIICKKDFSKGLSLWEKAMRQRWENFHQPLMKASVPYSLANFLGIQEVQTLQELHDLDKSPDNLDLHALCVIERIDVQRACFLHLDRVNGFFQRGQIVDALSLLCQLVERGKYCETSHALSYYAFMIYRDILTSNLPLPDGVNVFRLVLPLLQLLLDCLEERFHCLLEHSGRRRHDVLIARQYSCRVCRCMRDLQTAFCDAIELLLSVKNSATEDDLRELKTQVVTFIRMDPRLRQVTRLHVASQTRHSSSEVIRLFLESSVEAGPPTKELNSAAHLFADHQGRSPLHILAEKMTPTQLLDEGIVDSFVEHGAHLCARDKSGRSVLDILEGRDIHLPNSRPLSLQCLAARAVRREQDRGVLKVDELPNHLQRFLLDH